MLNLTIKRTPVLLPSLENDRHTEVWRDVQGSISAYGQIVGEDCWMHLPGLASFRLSRGSCEQSVAFADTAEDASIIEAYNRRVFPMALHLAGKEVMHASGVLSNAGVIAFGAASQTGKSTIACGFRSRGYTLWADDALAFEVSPDEISTPQLPFQLRLRPSAANFFGDCGHEDQVSGNGHPDSTSVNAPLLAVCVLRRSTNDSDQPVKVERLFSSSALKAVLPHAWCFTLQDPERKRRMMSNYLDLVARTAILDVCFKPGLENLPVILDAIESQLERIGPGNG